MRNVAFFLFLWILAPALLAWCAAESSAQVLVNEILADPASDWDGDGAVLAKNDEWVEVINAGSSTVDMSAYRLGDLSGGYSWRYGFSGTLAPGAVIVVYGSLSLAWEAATGYGSAGSSLNNTGDTVVLYKLEGSDTLVADSRGYLSHEVLDDRSTGRSKNSLEEWRVFDALNPYTGTNPPLGTGCVPTPGRVNDCGFVPVEAVTWGAIKEMFNN